MTAILVFALGCIISTGILLIHGPSIVHWLGENPAFIELSHTLSTTAGTDSAASGLSLALLLLPSLGVGLLLSAGLFKIGQIGVDLGFSLGMAVRKGLGLIPRPVISGTAVLVTSQPRKGK